MGAPAVAGRRRLLVEFAALYLAAPLAMAWMVASDAVPARETPRVFAAVFLAALLLLALTPGFSWRSLMRGGLLPDWKAGLAFAVVAFLGVYVLTLWLSPHSLFGFPRRAPELWTRVMIFYPLLSVLPQGIIYRALFFARYRPLFPSTRVAIVVNAAAFALGHLFFMNWVAVALCAVGGLAFAWAHAERDSFWFGNLLHAVGGWTVFTVGLGVYFYHGAI